MIDRKRRSDEAVHSNVPQIDSWLDVRRYITCLTHLFKLFFEAPAGLLLLLLLLLLTRCRRIALLRVVAAVPWLAAVSAAALRRFAGMGAGRGCRLVSAAASGSDSDSGSGRLRLNRLHVILRRQKGRRRRERERQIETAAAHRRVQRLQAAFAGQRFEVAVLRTISNLRSIAIPYFKFTRFIETKVPASIPLTTAKINVPFCNSCLNI